MKILMIMIAVLVAVTITTSSAQAFCGDSCVEGDHVMRDVYGNHMQMRDTNIFTNGTQDPFGRELGISWNYGIQAIENFEWTTYAHRVGRNYQPAYKEMGEGEN